MPAGLPPAPPEILQRIRVILVRDLKLDPSIEIRAEMPFFGSDIDLDSLDMLLLLTSIEKEFGFKVPSEAVGRRVFENVTTLADYISGHAADAAGGGESPAAPPGPAFDLSRLPHQDPFRFVSRVSKLTEGESGEGVWSVTGSEAFFAGHFPGYPIVPGVLIAEALAQLSGLVGPSSDGQTKWAGGTLAHADVRFERPVTPPADIVLQSRVTRTLGPLQSFEVLARVADAVVARGTLTLARSTGAGAAPDTSGGRA